MSSPQQTLGVTIYAGKGENPRDRSSRWIAALRRSCPEMSPPQQMLDRFKTLAFGADQDRL